MKLLPICFLLNFLAVTFSFTLYSEPAAGSVVNFEGTITLAEGAPFTAGADFTGEATYDPAAVTSVFSVPAGTRYEDAVTSPTLSIDGFTFTPTTGGIVVGNGTGASGNDLFAVTSDAISGPFAPNALYAVVPDSTAATPVLGYPPKPDWPPPERRVLRCRGPETVAPPKKKGRFRADSRLFGKSLGAGEKIVVVLAIPDKLVLGLFRLLLGMGWVLNVYLR